ncbi:cilia- and flagella-associated protein 65-like [Brachypodium distachyon]|uniref:cilia- and flagella-associated protein 65-like n=1 Tax=Brachypodium distachyon TaxID=15368 RepID=UPI00052FFFF2|nr:cilia- and flagella-associated protein 65-like [Brachypodium distachyon]|eukprot:XP_010233447.1 cilia- and flagella-associated protein 65-like [Brachypodium distachyon]
MAIDLDSDVEVAGMAEEPEAAPAPSPAALAATTAAPGAVSDDAPAATDAAGTGSSATRQETAPAGGAATPPAPQSPGAGEGEVAEEEQQDAPPQGDDSLPSQTVVAGASSSTGHRFLDAVQQLAFVTSFYQVSEHHAIVKSQLGEGLRVKLEVQIKATKSAVTAGARHETPLKTAKDKVARLETERAAVREELTKASEGNAAKAAELASQLFSSA